MSFLLFAAFDKVNNKQFQLKYISITIIGMDKDKKKELEKNSFKYKLKKTLIISISLLLVALTAIYITYICTHKDKERNQNVYNNNAPTEIIRKNLVEAFSNITSDGLVSFSLSEDDVNQMLYEGQKDYLVNKEESIYVSFNEESFTFYVDLEPTLGVKTRVSKEYSLSNVDSQTGTFYFKSSKSKMGRLTYIGGKHLQTIDIADLCLRSSLPIKYNKTLDTLEITPSKLLDYLPDTSYFNMLKELIEAKPEVISIDRSLPFGFKLDLSTFKSKGVTSLETPVTGEDILNRVTTSVTPTLLSSLASETTIATSFTLEEYASLFLLDEDYIDKYEYTSPLSSKKVTLSLSKGLSVSSSTDKLTYIFTMFIEGFGIDVNISTSSFLSGVNFTLTQVMDTKVYVGGYEFDTFSKINQTFMGLLSSMFDHVNDCVSFISKTPEMNKLTISFKDVVDNLDCSIIGFGFTLELDNISLDKFNLVVIRMIY